MDYFDEPLREAWKKLGDDGKATMQANYLEAKKAALLRSRSAW